MTEPMTPEHLRDVREARARVECVYVGRCNSGRCPKHGYEGRSLDAMLALYDVATSRAEKAERERDETYCHLRDVVMRSVDTDAAVLAHYLARATAAETARDEALAENAALRDIVSAASLVPVETRITVERLTTERNEAVKRAEQEARDCIAERDARYEQARVAKACREQNATLSTARDEAIKRAERAEAEAERLQGCGHCDAAAEALGSERRPGEGHVESIARLVAALAASQAQAEALRAAVGRYLEVRTPEWMQRHAISPRLAAHETTIEALRFAYDATPSTALTTVRQAARAEALREAACEVEARATSETITADRWYAKDSMIDAGQNHFASAVLVDVAARIRGLAEAEAGK